MIIGLYSIKDKLMDFNGVMSIKDDEMAERIFEAFCRKQKAENYTDSRYFELYHVGTFNTETGVIKGFSKQEIKLLKEGNQYDEVQDTLGREKA